jgi:hypothetical protein
MSDMEPTAADRERARLACFGHDYVAKGCQQCAAIAHALAAVRAESASPMEKHEDCVRYSPRFVPSGHGGSNGSTQKRRDCEREDDADISGVSMAELDDLRSKIAGWHFSKECLKRGEQKILYVAERIDKTLTDEIARLRAALAAKTEAACIQQQRAEKAERERDEDTARAQRGCDRADFVTKQRDALRALVRQLVEALRAVVRVADRKTVEFDAARDALTAAAKVLKS